MLTRVYRLEFGEGDGTDCRLYFSALADAEAARPPGLWWSNVTGVDAVVIEGVTYEIGRVISVIQPILDNPTDLQRC